VDDQTVWESFSKSKKPEPILKRRKVKIQMSDRRPNGRSDGI